MKTITLPLVLLALASSAASHASERPFRPYVATVTCGEARYTLTSNCVDSGDLESLNVCKPQTLAVERAGATRSMSLPRFSRDVARQMRTSGRPFNDLFVVKWACSGTARGAMATFYYSIGGGSAPDGEAWTYYDRTGKLIDDDDFLTPKEVNEIDRKFKPVPSIMPGSLPEER